MTLISKVNYRKDIDGLRAIAVLSVIFSHLNIPGFSGGFIGVDIFFVISGFLITRQILDESNNFSIANFYERRIRRIFPALFVVIAFVMVIGALIFNFRAFKDLGQSATATTLFSSNILFWYRGGYFAASSLEKPLLHTWSLAVEEQFYLLFPILLLIIRRYFNKKYFQIIFTIGVGSLFASIWSVHTYPEATFYLAPTRAWEIIAGSILAMRIISPLHTTVQRNLFSALGCVLIFYSIFNYTDQTIFPGFNAIPPVLGTCLIIYSGIGEYSVIGKVLQAKPMVFIGLISYSLYLWHWPLIAFSKYYLLRELNLIDTFMIISITFFIAIISFKFIEKPFRGNNSLIIKSSNLFAFAVIVMTVSALCGLLVSMENGMPNRYNEANSAIMRLEERDAEWKESAEIMMKNSSKLIGNASALPSFVLWGDSHAQALVPAISSVAKKYALSGIGISGHPPVLGLDIEGLPYSEAERNEVAISLIKHRPELKTVIIAARWVMYDDGHQFKNELPIINHRLKEVSQTNNVNSSNSVFLRSALFKTVTTLLALNRKVVVVMNVPEIGFNVPALHFISKIKNESYDYLLPTKMEYLERNKSVYDIFSDLSSLKGVNIIYPELYLFDEKDRAKVINDNNLLYRDDDHLSGYGAEFIAPVFEKIFMELTVAK